MSTATDDSRRHRAETLRWAMARAAGGPPVGDPYDDLARQIAHASGLAWRGGTPLPE
jgi:hypothetical protein